METEAVQIQMPKLSVRWKFTGEYRQPRDGEYYLFMGEVKFCKGRTAGWYPIVVYVGAEA